MGRNKGREGRERAAMREREASVLSSKLFLIDLARLQEAPKMYGALYGDKQR